MLGLDTQNFTSSAKKLQDENSNLKEACKANQDEKAFLLQRLEIMEQLLEKNAVMEISLLNLNAELEAVRKKNSVLRSCLSRRRLCPRRRRRFRLAAGPSSLLRCAPFLWCKGEELPSDIAVGMNSVEGPSEK
ncbi:hypothetical protein Ahy_A09g041444 isoform D [Arachis hypogaea]|uniref:Uncharacterized protein n=1 Tax=Arachis hypogaea TaxID=3818 RepID=A0A445BCS1_ARAHY|nr:hypothetical protein Ahy_A09g041444 isoform D [Arachis hypogaea]